MFKKQKTLNAEVNKAEKIERPMLSAYINQDKSFVNAYLKVIGSIAASDGRINLHEYSSLCEIVKLIDNSALASSVLLHSLQNPLELSVALNQLQIASENIDLPSRENALEAARNLLLLQGENTDEIAEKLAHALAIDLKCSESMRSLLTPKTTLWKLLARLPSKFTQDGYIIDIAKDCLKVTGNVDIWRAITDLKDGKIEDSDLVEIIIHSCDSMLTYLYDFSDKLKEAEKIKTDDGQFFENIQKLEDQIRQRELILTTRVDFEKRIFAEDIDDLIYDAGDAIESQMKQLFEKADWRDQDIWKSLSRTHAGKEIASRLERISSRRAESLRLLQEELKLFQHELSFFSNATILSRQHHSKFSELMPAMRLKTKVLDVVDKTADLTLKTGTASVLGAGAAFYFLGGAVVMPIAVQAAPFVIGGMLIAGIVKYVNDLERVKNDEVRHKRDAFESILRNELEKAKDSFNDQLESIKHDFQKAAYALLNPLILEAEATRNLRRDQINFSKNLVVNSREELERIKAVCTSF